MGHANWSFRLLIALSIRLFSVRREEWDGGGDEPEEPLETDFESSFLADIGELWQSVKVAGCKEPNWEWDSVEVGSVESRWLLLCSLNWYSNWGIQSVSLSSLRSNENWV